MTGLGKSGFYTLGLMLSNVGNMVQFIMFILKHRSGILPDTSCRLGLGRTLGWTLLLLTCWSFPFSMACGFDTEMQKNLEINK